MVFDGSASLSVTSGNDDPHCLARFVEAQDADHSFDDALTELRRGRKSGHWMWFVFPQIAGLGQSAMSRRFAIASLGEATAYLEHGVLGPRIIECAQALIEQPTLSAEQILGGIDAMKLRSSMTLFMRAAPDEPVFGKVLDRYFDGQADPRTEERLEIGGNPPPNS
jgi:uncharacterized protein (DUF1810 family)